MAVDPIHILFVQNLPSRGLTAIEAFRPSPSTSRMYVVREQEALRYLSSKAGPEPELIVLDVEMSESIQEAIRRELEESGRTRIPVVRLERTD